MSPLILDMPRRVTARRTVWTGVLAALVLCSAAGAQVLPYNRGVKNIGIVPTAQPGVFDIWLGLDVAVGPGAADGGIDLSMNVGVSVDGVPLPGSPYPFGLLIGAPPECAPFAFPCGGLCSDIVLIPPNTLPSFVISLCDEYVVFIPNYGPVLQCMCMPFNAPVWLKLVSFIPVGDPTVSVCLEAAAGALPEVATGDDCKSAPFIDLAVSLLDVDAQLTREGVVVTWSTASEVDNAGFRVWRGPTAQGPFELVQPDVIPAQGGPTQGASYVVIDDHVPLAVNTPWYQIEDIDLSGVSTMHAPVPVTNWPPAAWWRLGFGLPVYR